MVNSSASPPVDRFPAKRIVKQTVVGKLPDGSVVKRSLPSVVFGNIGWTVRPYNLKEIQPIACSTEHRGTTATHVARNQTLGCVVGIGHVDPQLRLILSLGERDACSIG